jgi:hypothetical protein
MSNCMTLNEWKAEVRKLYPGAKFEKDADGHQAYDEDGMFVGDWTNPGGHYISPPIKEW